MHNLQDFVLQYERSIRTTCPACSPDRKKKGEKTLSITVNHDSTVYLCHHCGVTGGVKRKKFYEEHMKPEKVTKIPTQLNYNVDLIKEFFSNRG